ncbi:hypothetical protein TWF103_003144 [Orbilia oligospora]|nr:hypothetical protein TWF103_003144 [Orbilia oligospora]
MFFSSPWLRVPQDPDGEVELDEWSSFLNSLQVKRPQAPQWLDSKLPDWLRLPSKKHFLFFFIPLATYGIGWWHGGKSQLPEVQGQQGDYYFHPPIPMNELANPPIPYSYNIAPNAKNYSAPVKMPATPLFIPFTKNHKMLEQTVLSYIAVGWPRSDIVVIDNTGTMDANAKGLLSPNNLFYLNYDLLRKRYGVSVLRTPTLLNFSQLQNFMISAAMSRGWAYFFWSHQDVIVVSREGNDPFKGFYDNILESLTRLKATMGPEAGEDRWVIAFYSYDWLTVVNVSPLALVGQWDVFIPYYATDCDWYHRAHMAGLKLLVEDVGLIFDMSASLTEPEKLLFGDGGDGIKPNSTKFQELIVALEAKGRVGTGPDPPDYSDRFFWQTEIMGGWGEPWTYNPDGLTRAYKAMGSAGRIIFSAKWGLPEASCELFREKIKAQREAWSFP